MARSPPGVAYRRVERCGLGLLVNVVTVAILSTPRFRYFGDDQLNVWVTYPHRFVWLPAVMVLAALAGHLLVFRRSVLPFVRPPHARKAVRSVAFIRGEERMKRSVNRILTTHTGSLCDLRSCSVCPRTAERRLNRRAAFDSTLKEAVRDVVARQAAAGIDVPNDGEFGNQRAGRSTC